MKRLTISPRPNWPDRVAAYGLTFHTIRGEMYWDESCCYQFTAAEVDEIEDASNALHALCLDTVEAVIRAGDFAPFAIPDDFIPLVVRSWEERRPSLYGRFDFAYDGTHPPKLLEYNADTPTALLEASVIQWFWLEETHAGPDQFNSIHEHLLARFQALHATLPALDAPTWYFASVGDSEEDYITVNYLRDLAMQAGFATAYLPMHEIGWHQERGCFVDMAEREIARLFKLYPWEWLAREPFGPYLLRDRMQLFEPAWKMLLSNKALLPLLWQRYPDHPNLLPAAWEPLGETFVRKPILSREGANIRLVADGVTLIETPGIYDDVPCIYQAYHPLPEFGGNYPVIGSWIVGDASCGMGIREDRTPITQDTSRFVPHWFA